MMVGARFLQTSDAGDPAQGLGSFREAQQHPSLFFFTRTHASNSLVQRCARANSVLFAGAPQHVDLEPCSWQRSPRPRPLTLSRNSVTNLATLGRPVSLQVLPVPELRERSQRQ